MFRTVLGSSRAGAGGAGLAYNTWADLDWPAWCEALASRCTTADGRALALDLGILPSSFVHGRQLEVQETMRLLETGAHPPIGDIPDLRHALLRCTKVDALEASDLLALAGLLAVASRVRRFYDAHAERIPRLVQYADSLADHRELATQIRSTFDDTGWMRDEASSELMHKRRRLKRVRDAIMHRLDKYLRDPKYEGILQEDFVTLRDERFVIPVRAGERGDIRGIVHAQSGSGGTLFMEPQELVPLNNEMAIVQTDIAVEERRIRRALTHALLARVDDLEYAADMLAFLDLTHAMGLLSVETQGHQIQWVSASHLGFELRRARHPLLALRAHKGDFHVVENTIQVQARTRALIISGPNTGGKTVILKTLGVFALMARAGFALPASPDSTMPIFERVFTDIGDEQSIQSDLSTFSAHVKNIASFVQEVRDGDLVLLDELFAGTDPGQATTLGRALIDDLIGRGAFVVVTTHLEGLKSIAFEDERYAAASMAFDLEQLAPTYKLRPGIPGASWAHRIAAKLGIPEAIVERARKMEAPQGHVVDEQKLAKIEDALRQAETAAADAMAAQKEAAEDRKRAADELARAKDKQKRELDKEVAQLHRDARDMRLKIRDLQRHMQTLIESERPTDEEAERILQEARQIARQVQEKTRQERVGTGALQDRSIPRVEDLAKGDHVWVIPYGHHGVIDESIRDPQSISVKMGPLSVRVAISQLRLSDPTRAKAEQERQQGKAVVPNWHDDDLSFRVDLRGQRVEDAEEIVDAYMERADRASLPFVMFIHGHGTGALKRAVRARLMELPYDIRIRAGERGEGGEGVTFAEFSSRTSSEQDSH